MGRPEGGGLIAGGQQRNPLFAFAAMQLFACRAREIPGTSRVFGARSRRDQAEGLGEAQTLGRLSYRTARTCSVMVRSWKAVSGTFSQDGG
jgi:hypothetical protein